MHALLTMLPLLPALAFWIASGDSLVKTCRHMCTMQTQHHPACMNTHLPVMHAHSSLSSWLVQVQAAVPTRIHFCAWYIFSFTLKSVACMHLNLNRNMFN